MADEFESQSWKDRCDRYFSSISDTGKDRDQEKHAKNDSENTRERRVMKNGLLDDNDKEWRDLSEVRNVFSEYWLLRSARRVMSMLDIHGARVASKTTGTVGFIIWMIIVVISVLTFGSLLYFILRDYSDEPSTFRINSIRQSKGLISDDISLTVCNLNVIKKSQLVNSGLNDLDDLINGKNIIVTREETNTVREELETNKKLKAFLLTRNTDTFSEFVASTENDIVVQELTRSSNLSLLHRLSQYGKPGLLKEVVQLSKADVEKMGHATNETLVKCWKDNRQCQPMDIQTKTDPDYGNCIAMSTLKNTRTVELVLNVQSEEYIEYLSPSAEFIVSLGHGSDILQNQVVQISPGFHSTVSVNKLTSLKRLDRSCSTSGVSKKICERNCLKDHLVRLCGCSIGGEDMSLNICKMNQASDYICVKSLQRLQFLGNLPCQCRERCSEKKLDLQMSAIGWPSEQYTEKYGQQNVTKGYIRENIALLTIHLSPMFTEEIEEYEPFEIMDIFVRIGGLSAFVAGVSVVTVLEILYMVLQSVVQFVRYIRKRSSSVASPRRLSDSEITSITWAMYRQRRRLEEVNKTKEDKTANNAGVNALGGNVQARILKRSSYAAAETRELNNEHVTASNDNPSRHNGYSRRYDGKNPFYQSRTREIYAKDSDSHKIDNRYSTNGGNYTVNVIRPPRQNDYIYDNRHEPVYTGNVLHPNGVKYKDRNTAEKHHPENVFLYNGAVAYFSPNVSEPVYL
ncbi:amiloride-sensitive sodium channel subunit alpha-like [Mercenaria mercenaria]|uniref:amiloride-sensitive sodium channel subunit alpha-like n=1 Tax=Mercenaria mercenaria TaxID=6596 RepID=UPI00234FB1B8|nr:amiloride-sensitive sodium channel subunit alpha-like [Mercenaria mercenaria]